MGKFMTFKLDHIGVVVENISEFVKIFHSLGFNGITRPEPDPIQKVAACFIPLGNRKETYIELLEPTHDDSPITKFLKKKGGGLHHLCFEVDDIEGITSGLMRQGFPMVSPPVECVGYDRSFKRQCKQATRISFLFLSNKLLIELLQKGV